MTIKQFIEKAIEGGWKTGNHYEFSDGTRYDQSGILLDPEAWKAVGKVEGWKEDTHYTVEGVRVREGTNYVKNMHRLIDALAEGKTVEEYLASL